MFAEATIMVAGHQVHHELMERMEDTWLSVRVAAVSISLPYAHTTSHRSVREELFPIAFRAICHRQICVPLVQQSNIPEIASSVSVR
jgi:hypothetical protein